MTSIDVMKGFETKKDILADSKLEQEKLSKEKLQTINNHDFLSISPENRLQYITKRNITSNDLIKKDFRINSLEFTFTFNGKFNKELYLKTTAGQVLPKEVGSVEKGGEIYTRNNLKGEFFNNAGKRLIIKEATKIDVEKIRTPEEIKNLEDSNNKALQTFEKSKDYKKEYSDIVSEAIKRGIDPKIVNIEFSEKVKKLSIVSIERKVLLEEMFTEYDRKRGKKHGVLKDKTAKEYGIKKEESVYNKESYQTRQEFYSLVKKEAKIIEKKYNIPWKVTLGQAILESGHGESKLTKKYNNFFGHTAKPGQKSVQMRDNGNLRNFAIYDSPLEGLESHGKFLSSSRYKKAFAFKDNPIQFLKEIQKVGYAEDPNYVSKVVATIRARGINV